MRLLTVWVILLGATLAGCTDGPAHSMENGHDHGILHTCPDGTVIDPADYADHHGGTFDPASKCPEPTLPAKVNLAVEGAGRAFESLTIRWDVTPAGKQGDDATAIVTQVLARRDAASPPPSADGYGEVTARFTSASVPDQFVRTWAPTDDGDWFLRAHARLDGEDVWSEEVKVAIQPVVPTGIIHEVFIEGGPTGPSLSPADLTITVGDAVVWVDEDAVFDYEIASEQGPTTFTARAAAGSTSDEALFLKAGTWTYTVDEDSPLARQTDGTLTVLPP